MVSETGLEPVRSPTRPSNVRVCQFRHSDTALTFISILVQAVSVKVKGSVVINSKRKKYYRPSKKALDGDDLVVFVLLNIEGPFVHEPLIEQERNDPPEDPDCRFVHDLEGGS